MDRSPPVKKQGRADVGNTGSNPKAIETNPALNKFRSTGKPADQKERFEDLWIEARFHYLAFECARLHGGSVAKFFLKEAGLRYKRYTRSGYPRLRYLCWNALNVLAGKLVCKAREQSGVSGKLASNTKEAQ
jgi:hypothetical protein